MNKKIEKEEREKELKYWQKELDEHHKNCLICGNGECTIANYIVDEMNNIAK